MMTDQEFEELQAKLKAERKERRKANAKMYYVGYRARNKEKLREYRRIAHRKRIAERARLLEIAAKYAALTGEQV